MEILTMAIPESPMKDNYSIPVDNSPEKAEENGSVQDKPNFTFPSTKNISGITFLLSEKSQRDAFNQKIVRFDLYRLSFVHVIYKQTVSIYLFN